MADYPVSRHSPEPSKPRDADAIHEGEFGRFVKMVSDRFDDIKTLIDTGFEGVHRRQDTTNGRIGTLEVKVDRIDREGCAVGCKFEPPRSKWVERGKQAAIPGAAITALAIEILHQLGIIK